MWQVLGRAKAHTSVLGPFVTQSDGRAETRTADCVRVRTSLYYHALSAALHWAAYGQL